MDINVIAFWDVEAKVWTASSEDVSGLVTEAPTLDKLATRICEAGFDLLKMQAAFDQEGTIEVNFHIDCDVLPTAKTRKASPKTRTNTQVSFNLNDSLLIEAA